MGFTAVPDVATGDVFTEAMWDTYIKDNFNTGVPVKLADTTLGSAAANIVLSSIPDTWSHLLLECYMRTEQAVTVTGAAWRINADAGANYDLQYAQGNGGSGSSGELFGQTSDAGFSVFSPGASGGANLFGSATIFIPNYANTSNNKIAHVLSSSKYGTGAANMHVRQSTVAWRSNAAINRIEFFNLAVANLSAGSRVTLYGMP